MIIAIPIRARSPVRATSRRRRSERVVMDTYSPSPRASETLIVEPSPNRYLSPSPRGYDYSTSTTKRTVSRSRSISIQPRRRRHSSPPRMLLERRSERSDNPSHNALVIRPRDSDSDLDDYAIDHYRPPFDPSTALYGDGDQEEVLEVKRDRRGMFASAKDPQSSIITDICTRAVLPNCPSHACNDDLTLVPGVLLI